MNEYKFKISIVLPTYQSLSSLAHSLSNVLLQDFPEDDYEVILVSHGVDKVLDIFNWPIVKVKHLKTVFVERSPQNPTNSPCVVYNRGIERAEGKLVFLMHDNVDLIGKDYLKKLWEFSNEGERAVMTTKMVYRYNKDGTFGLNKLFSGFYGQNDAIPLKFLEKVKGYDEVYDGDAGYMDIDLMMRCKKEGCEFFGAPKDFISVKHNIKDLFTLPVHRGGARNLKILRDRGFDTTEYQY